MKELNPIEPDRVKIVNEKQQEVKLEYLGSVRPKKGHTLFKVNTYTGEISEAEYSIEPLSLKRPLTKQELKNPPVKKKVLIEKDYIYMSALNKKNVIRKLNQEKK